MKDIHDVIKHAKFGDDRLRGSGVVAGQISPFPIDFAGRPYNTLTLPCERVIYRRPRPARAADASARRAQTILLVAFHSASLCVGTTLYIYKIRGRYKRRL